jgi:hypothetical protein
VARFILLVVVSVCVVFCVLCSYRGRDDYIFIFGCNFFQFCNNWCLYFDPTDGYLRFISTVGQTTVPFFLVVIVSGCNLNPPKNIAGQTTVPFFSGSNFSGRKYHNWCSCQNTNTNYNPKKLQKKKVQLSGQLCFLNHRKKIRPEKKVQSSDRRLKQISDNRLSCQNTNTPITTGKNYYRKKRYDTCLSCQNTNTTNHTLI